MLKAVLHDNHGWKVEKGSYYSKKYYSAALEKHMYLFKEKDLGLKLQHLAHCFPVRIESFFEKNTPCLSLFSRRRSLTWFQIGAFQ
jgi:hypothetical protein